MGARIPKPVSGFLLYVGVFCFVAGAFMIHEGLGGMVIGAIAVAISVE